MTQRRWIVFAGGGTGGHLFPALSVVESLRERDESIDVSFFCTDRPIDGEILGAAGVTAVPQRVMPLTRRLLAMPRFLWRWRESVRLCLAAFRERRPAAVVGAGGYASGPPVRAAARLGVPTFLLNPDAVPGQANRHMAVRGAVSGVFAQWEVTRQHFPASVPVMVTGCPVRPAFRRLDGEAVGSMRASFHLDPGRPTLLVTGASQGARTINEAMMRLVDVVVEADWQVLHLSGAADAQQVEQTYQAAAAVSKGRFQYCVLPFTDRMPEAMAAADLIISRAGASTLSEIQAMGKPAILLPYPYHRDQHQRHNAAVLAEAGAAVLLDDQRDACANAMQLRPVLTDLLSNTQRRLDMSQAVRGLDRPQAAVAIADRLHETGLLSHDGACELPANKPVKCSSHRLA